MSTSGDVRPQVAGCRSQEPPTSAQDEVRLLELQQLLAQAWVAGDRVTVERIIAPDWTSTGPDGRASDRATVLAQVSETGVHKIHDLTIEDAPTTLPTRTGLYMM